MDRDSIDSRLALGKEAARRGDNALAQKYLQEVVELEPENEAGWLWLSAVVEQDADKRLCLENVLVLNPQNQAAQKGLARLAVEESGHRRQSHPQPEWRRQPLTPAGAILYPERQNQDWEWHDPVELQRASIAPFSTTSEFADVWQRDQEICAYCATELNQEDRRCPGCGRQLIETAFRYPRASNDLTIYWVLILGIGQLALITILINLIGRGSPASLAWQSLVFLTMVILVIGLAFRRFWAYAGSIVFLLMLVAAMILSSTLGPTVDNTLSQLAGRDFFLRIGENPYELFIGPASSIVRLLQYVAVPIALLYALLKVGPDFERTKVRRTAQLDRGVSDASHFNGTGEAYGERGMWATAVLHFQRAAALEPANPYYQRKLGEAYAQLGHYQRSLDVLESARQLTRDPEAQATIERQMAGIRQRMQPDESEGSDESQAE